MLARFYDSESGFQDIHHSLKQHPCPHCRRSGTLILHGYIKGLSDTGGNDKIIRGHRVFCSNRHRRAGCGRTFSILLAAYVRNFIITAVSIWKFLLDCSKSGNKYQSFTRLNLSFATSAVYRVYRRFYERQPFLRSQLLSICPCPRVTSPDPISQTIRHLQSAFKNAACPLSALQLTCQKSLL